MMDRFRRVEISRTGVTVLNPQQTQETQVDIIFVHGLNGTPDGTWTYKGPKKDSEFIRGENSSPTTPAVYANEDPALIIGEAQSASVSKEQPEDLHLDEGTHETPERQKKRSILSRGLFNKSKGKQRAEPPAEHTFFWPQNLPKECASARVMTFGYDADVTKFFGGTVNQNTFYNHAEDLLGALVRNRRNAQNRPLILVAHSLGGLVVKQMLFQAERSIFPEQQKVHQSTKGLFFLGTPHTGSDYAAWGEIGRHFIKLAFDTNPTILKNLKVNGEPLKQLEKNFDRLIHERTFWIYTFTEAKGYSPMPFLRSKVVDENYNKISDPGRVRTFTINANHVGMCRYWGREDPGYQITAVELADFAKDVIEEMENKSREAEKGKSPSPG
ncbi:hypothetical protein K449DRAFT_143998 [Hypoxylon sp. EC38]|nr:hypothetical protein K449DRAFT_143998 [Hypoxylon sp. EC38]